MSEDPDHANILRILVATDCHLGYEEKDPIRGMDSFAAFEEVLLTAKKKEVDFVLLGGDLFHDNMPSRHTLYRAISILRKHCMSDEPVSFQIISDSMHHFKPLGLVNYLDPNYSVGLTVFSIHGNHDDPTSDGHAKGPFLAALDLLQAANLVNYFGRQETTDAIEVNPVIIQKGTTRLAMYGLGAMRDDRLNRMWNSKRVTFRKASDEAMDEDWFNMFVLHQNRDTGRGKKSCVHESMIPGWMDMVVWGHEHECKIWPVHSNVADFYIMQPGSTVATSLVEGEAVTKHCSLVEIRGNEFKTEKYPLRQVRDFVMKAISLSDIPDLEPGSPDVQAEVGKHLETKMQEMLEDAKQLALQKPGEIEGQGFKLVDPDKPLLRLRVEHSDFPVLNAYKFGHNFIGKVANPSSLLLFHKQRAQAAKEEKTGNDASAGAAAGGDPLSNLTNPVAPDDGSDYKVEDLLESCLGSGTTKLQLFPEKKLGAALGKYVNKGEAAAMETVVEELLDSTKTRLKREARTQFKAPIEELIQKAQAEEAAKQKADQATTARIAELNARMKARGEKPITLPETSANDVDEGVAANGPAKGKGRGKAKAKAVAKPQETARTARGRKQKTLGFEGSSDEDEDEEETTRKGKGATKKKAPARKTAPRYASKRVSYADAGEDFLEDSEDEEAAPSRATGKATRKSQVVDISDSDSDAYEPAGSDQDQMDDDIEDSEDSSIVKPKAKPKAKPIGKPKAKAKAKPQSRKRGADAANSDGGSGNDSDGFTAPAPKKRQRKLPTFGGNRRPAAAAASQHASAASLDEEPGSDMSSFMS